MLAFLGNLTWVGWLGLGIGALAALYGLALLIEAHCTSAHGRHWAARWKAAGPKDVDRFRSAWNPWQLREGAIQRRGELKAWKSGFWDDGHGFSFRPLGAVLLVAWAVLVLLNLPLLGLIMDLFFGAGRRIPLPLLEEPLSIGAVLFAGLVALLETIAGIFLFHGRSKPLRWAAGAAVIILALGEGIGAWIRTSLMGGEGAGALGQIMQMGPFVASIVGLLVPAFEALSAGTAWGEATQHVVKRVQWLVAITWYVLASPFLMALCRSWTIFHEITGAAPPPPPPWSTMCPGSSSLEEGVESLKQALEKLEKETLPVWCRELDEATRDAARTADRFAEACAKMRRQMEGSLGGQIASLDNKVEALQQRIERLVQEAAGYPLLQKVRIVMRWDWRYWGEKKRHADDRQTLLHQVSDLAANIFLNGKVDCYPLLRRLDEIQQRGDELRDLATGERNQAASRFEQVADLVRLQAALDHTPEQVGDTVRHGACPDVLTLCEQTLNHAAAPCAERVHAILSHADPGAKSPNLFRCLSRCEAELARARENAEQYNTIHEDYAEWADALRRTGRQIEVRLHTLRP
jgi:hypothetical protein